MWASNLSGSVSLGAKFGPRRQYRYSASKPLCYWFNGSMLPTKGRSPHRGGLDVYDLPRHPSAGSCLSPLAYDLERILR